MFKIFSIMHINRISFGSIIHSLLDCLISIFWHINRISGCAFNAYNCQHCEKKCKHRYLPRYVCFAFHFFLLYFLVTFTISIYKIFDNVRYFLCTRLLRNRELLVTFCKAQLCSFHYSSVISSPFRIMCTVSPSTYPAVSAIST
ncbi:MAG: hypothetical protein EMLJLAPB_01224 [Candidatus Argoarchaeum ethanivorans]|uniref:Uncharacterized protein n=1 Tax=Candidatus Argoarchaeum ethanivorans TaxID=2608793 RepID=A0A811TF75_9EURY|nr:MAG: hypothetical protein EMLJLAPB_01224 [Candidatus Argoarchaeum ethanivorans]